MSFETFILSVGLIEPGKTGTQIVLVKGVYRMMPKQSHFKASCHSDMCFRVSPGHKELCWQRYLTLTASPNPHWCIYLLPGREWNGRRASLRMPPAWTLPLSCCFTHHSWTFWGILEGLGIHKEAESMKARSILLTKDAYSISVTLAFGREGDQLLGSLESHVEDTCHWWRF